jgi:hypothetical protein
LNIALTPKALVLALFTANRNVLRDTNILRKNEGITQGLPPFFSKIDEYFLFYLKTIAQTNISKTSVVIQ